jgi:hypothetical protein
MLVGFGKQMPQFGTSSTLMRQIVCEMSVSGIDDDIKQLMFRENFD